MGLYLAFSMVPATLGSEDRLGLSGLEVAHTGSQHSIHQQGLFCMPLSLMGGRSKLIYSSPCLWVVFFIVFISARRMTQFRTHPKQSKPVLKRADEIYHTVFEGSLGTGNFISLKTPRNVNVVHVFSFFQSGSHVSQTGHELTVTQR